MFRPSSEIFRPTSRLPREREVWAEEAVVYEAEDYGKRIICIEEKCDKPWAYCDIIFCDECPKYQECIDESRAVAPARSDVGVMGRTIVE